MATQRAKRAQPRQRTRAVSPVTLPQTDSQKEDAQDGPQDGVVERIPLGRDDRLLLTPREAARRLSIGATLCYRLIGRGDIPSILIGCARRIPVVALDAYIAAQMARQMPAQRYQR